MVNTPLNAPERLELKTIRRAHAELLEDAGVHIQAERIVNDAWVMCLTFQSAQQEVAFNERLESDPALEALRAEAKRGRVKTNVVPEENHLH